MSTQVLMPQMGESIAEGTIVVWFKKPGDKVEKDEPLFEISTDKVDAEIPSPASGYLSEILHGAGETVEVNKVVATISAQPAQPGTAKSGGSPTAAADSSKTAVSPTASAGGSETPVSPTVSAGGTKTPVSPTVSAGGTKTPVSHTASAGGSKTAVSATASVEELRRTRSSPLVRKMAAEHGLDLTQIQGTGISGRVTKTDVLQYLERKPAAARPAAAAPAASRNGSKFAYTPQSGDRVEPFSPMRASIAEHMLISRETSVHVTTVFEVDMSHVARLRQTHKAAYAAKNVNLTFMPFIMKAVTEGLKEFPVLNSSVVDNSVVYKSDVNLGMAVALDWGLLVPVIRRADELSLLGLARAVNDLAERARSKKLAPDEVQNGTFTITNPGVFGSLFGTPIINQPQVAILGVGSIAKRAVVTEDDAIAIRHMMYLALSFDHRVIDGATADRFMSRVKTTLQTFPEAAV